MEIPDSNDPLGHVDGLERPIPTPKGKINYSSFFFFFFPPQIINILYKAPKKPCYVFTYLYIHLCKNGSLACLHISDAK